MLEAKLDYLIHFSTTPKQFVNVYRPMLPWGKWADRVENDYGFLVLIEGLNLGCGKEEKFSEENILVVETYTDARKESLRIQGEINPKG